MKNSKLTSVKVDKQLLFEVQQILSFKLNKHITKENSVDKILENWKLEHGNNKHDKN